MSAALHSEHCWVLLVAHHSVIYLKHVQHPIIQINICV